MNDRHFSSFHLAGFTYYEGVDVFEELKVGTVLTLSAEPENRYDPQAVAIFFRNRKLEYVPREENKLVSKFLSLGYTDLFEVLINRVSPDSHPEKQIGVVVRILPRE